MIIGYLIKKTSVKYHTNLAFSAIVVPGPEIELWFMGKNKIEYEV